MPKYSAERDLAKSARAYGYELHCSQKDCMNIAHALRGMSVEAAKKYLEDIIAMKRALPAIYHKKKRLHQKGIGLLSPQEIRYRWPYLRADDLRGGTFCSWEGYAGPYEALTGYAKGARKKGVKIHENTVVQKILVENGKVTGVATPKGHISAPIIINAAGPYAEEVGKMAGVEIPVKPYRRQIFFTAAFPWIQDPIPLVIDFHRGWYFRREGEGLLISGPKDEYPSFNVAVDYDAMVEVAENSLLRVPLMEKAQITRGWAGSYEISPDNHAILGKIPEVEGALPILILGYVLRMHWDYFE